MDGSSNNAFKTEYLDKYYAVGEQKFYRFLLCTAISKILKIKSGEYKGNQSTPDVELLEYAERFLILYRRDGEEIYLSVSKTLRRAAHRIYRLLLKKDMVVKNSKFLNLVSNDRN